MAWIWTWHGFEAAADGDRLVVLEVGADGLEQIGEGHGVDVGLAKSRDNVLRVGNNSKCFPAVLVVVRALEQGGDINVGHEHLHRLPGTTDVAWDTAGNFLWDKYSGGLSGVDVEIDGNKNINVLTSGSNQVSPTSGADIVIYKLNSAGTQLWKKKYDFGGQDVPTRFTFVSNKLSVIGYGSIAGSYFDWLTFQVNNSGTKLWDVRYNATSGNDEQPYSLTAKANGEVFVTGKGGPMFTQLNGSSYLRIVTLKYSNTGVMQWRDTANIYSGWGLASTLASDSSLFVLGGTNMTAFHFLIIQGWGPAEFLPE